MRRLVIAFVCLQLPSCVGCAPERQSFPHHNPFTDTVVMAGELVGACLKPLTPGDYRNLTDVRHSSDEPAEIRPL